MRADIWILVAGEPLLALAGSGTEVDQLGPLPPWDEPDGGLIAFFRLTVGE